MGSIWFLAHVGGDRIDIVLTGAEGSLIKARKFFLCDPLKC